MVATRWNTIRNSAAIVTSVVVAVAAARGFADERPALTMDELALVWKLLERDARNSADAGFLLYVLHREPGDILQEGWAKFGGGQQWLDWWLVLRPRPHRPFGGDDFYCFIDDCDESETRAVTQRPERLTWILHANLYLLGIRSDRRPEKDAISVDEVKEAWLDWKGSAYLENHGNDKTDSSQGYYDQEARRVRYWCRHVNNLRLCYWLFGRGDEAKSVTTFTWKRDYLAFRKWITENEPYLRFQEKDQRFVLDQDAKKARQPVPVDARRIPSPSTPFPDWKGSLPTVYDYDLGK